jgi:predicted nucleotidyltransferase
MTNDEILETLRRSEPELRAKGVRHAGLFGSMARGEAGPDSDIDIMIDLDPDASLWQYSGVKLFIADLFEGPVDVVDRNSLKPSVKPRAIADLIDAF